MDSANSFYLQQETCKHEVAISHMCIDCRAHIPKFGSICDTGNASTYIKVVYVDESTKGDKEVG